MPYTGDLPLRGAVVRDYFDNLLPDSEPIRKRLASQYKLASIDAFDLLQEIGRDCVGAVQLLKEDEAPTDVKRIEGTPMLEEDVEQHLIGLTQPKQAGAGMTAYNLRISLAGAQEKTALLWHDGGWMRPHGSTPTTHILKPRLAMALLGKNEHYRFADVQRLHFNSTAAKCFLRKDSEDVIESLLARTAGAIDAVAARLPVGFPQRVADTIFAGIVRSTKLLGDMPKK